MKRKSMVNTNLLGRFQDEEMSNKKLNYLKGGDADGSQGGTDPWDPPA